MKTAAVSTFCEWTSFGSVLQAIGLQDTLHTMGVTGTVVRVQADFDCGPVKQRLEISPSGLIKACDRFIHADAEKRAYLKNTKFIQEHVRVQTYSSDQALMRNPPDADVYIAGSDQIWYHAVKRDDFFLNYKPENKPGITYAASMGSVVVPEEKRKWYREHLKRFDSISVREEDMVSELEQLTDKPVQVHIDPTFLKSAEEWRKLQKPRKVKEPYILVYPLYWDSRLNDQLKQLKRQTGYEIISIHSGLRNIYADRVIRDADAGEFLWLVDHAQCVVTSSFHGVAFSTIFNKKYSAVINPAAPSRIENILNVLGIKTPDITGCISEFDADYAAVNRRIQKEKTRSLSYLRGVIFGET